MYLLILTITLWGFIHSFLASLAVKETIRKIIGKSIFRYYRLAYNVFSVVSFLPVVFLKLWLPDRLLYSVPPPWNYFMAAFQAISVLLVFKGILQTDALAFIGLRQVISDQPASRPVTNGLYKFVRHPLYSLGMVFIWLSPVISVNTFIIYLSLTGYLVVGALFEERKLLREFGQAYADYKQKTPMFIPRLK